METNMLRESAVAKYLGLSVITVRKFRMDGTGPRFAKLGSKAVVYDPADIRAWIESRKVNSTSQRARASA